MDELAPLTTTTRGVGELIRFAMAEGARQIWVALDSTASTDCGLGALRALGAVALDSRGDDMGEDCAGLGDNALLNFVGLIPISNGVTLLTDDVASLAGPHGAAWVFEPQKGSTPRQVELMVSALRPFALLAGGDLDAPGAGGTDGGFMAAYGASIHSGAD